MANMAKLENWTIYSERPVLWYKVEGTDQRIIVTTCHKATNLDTVIAVYENDGCSRLSCEDWYMVNFDLVA